ncbi:ABC transporter ATP-binding protein [Amorphus coralli]|uniref:ABC transporter ATP-binding protein n=1 Tax=Amorphus coralli TaxID=340680 RepID=UPI00035D481B|nr:ABC transporter ATP-binding protein [Amorphus coralli]
MRIEGTGLTVRIGATSILSGVDVAAEPGELVGLIGPNGAGKSTLLSVLARLRTPQAGTLAYDGAPAARMDGRALARRLAMLAQSGGVEWPLTVDRVVAIGRLPHAGRFAASDPEHDREAIQRAMHAANVEALAGRTVDTLSGGERTRVLLARALAVEAEMLLADEPIAALDPYHQIEVMELLAAVVRRGGGVVVVLHDLSLAARFCDRLVLLDRGRVVADATPEQVLTEDRIAAVYGVSVELGSRDGARFVVPWTRLRKADGEG